MRTHLISTTICTALKSPNLFVIIIKIINYSILLFSTCKGLIQSLSTASSSFSNTADIFCSAVISTLHVVYNYANYFSHLRPAGSGGVVRVCTYCIIDHSNHYTLSHWLQAWSGFVSREQPISVSDHAVVFEWIIIRCAMGISNRYIYKSQRNLIGTRQNQEEQF